MNFRWNGGAECVVSGVFVVTRCRMIGLGCLDDV